MHHDARPPLSIHVHRLVIRAAQHAAQNQLPHGGCLSPVFAAVRRRAIGGRGRWKDATGVGAAVKVDSVLGEVNASPIAPNALPTDGTPLVSHRLCGKEARYGCNPSHTGSPHIDKPSTPLTTSLGGVLKVPSHIHRIVHRVSECSSRCRYCSHKCLFCTRATRSTVAPGMVAVNSFAALLP